MDFLTCLMCWVYKKREHHLGHQLVKINDFHGFNLVMARLAFAC
jgi:hypothetical protein